MKATDYLISSAALVLEKKKKRTPLELVHDFMLLVLLKKKVATGKQLILVSHVGPVLVLLIN